MTARAAALFCPTCQSSLEGRETACPVCGTPLVGLSFVLEAGTALSSGRYTLEHVLGQGGFGITYAALDHVLGREVAVKELFPEGSSRLGGTFKPAPSLGFEGFAEAKRGFLSESRVLAGFAHSGIVRVFDTFEENGTAYLVMERLNGETLGQRLEREDRISPDRVVKIALEVGEALSVVHAAGLLHRDLKPENIFLEASGRTVLIDFGSARGYAGGKTTSVTRLVTQGYAPPEQYATRAKFGAYTDLYALGATLWHALTGSIPATATDRMLGTQLPALKSLLPSLERKPSKQALERAVERCLKLRVEERPQSTLEFLGILRTQQTEVRGYLELEQRLSSPVSRTPPVKKPPSSLPVPRLPALPAWPTSPSLPTRASPVPRARRPLSSPYPVTVGYLTALCLSFPLAFVLRGATLLPLVGVVLLSALLRPGPARAVVQGVLYGIFAGTMFRSPLLFVLALVGGYLFFEWNERHK